MMRAINYSIHPSEDFGKPGKSTARISVLPAATRCKAKTGKNATAQKKVPRRKWKDTLAGDTFQTLYPYIDVFGCGEWWQDAPHFSITNEQEAQYANRFAFDDPKKIAKQYHAGRMTPKRIQRGIECDDQYFTCNKGSASSRSLAYLDLDDHLPEQNDKPELTQAVLNLLGPTNLFANEGRLWLKGDWKDSDYPTFKKAYTAFTSALDSWAVAHGFATNVDSPKGFNQLGRLPLKNWNYDKLESFRQTAHVTVEQLKDWTRMLQEDTTTYHLVTSDSEIESATTEKAATGLEMPLPRIKQEQVQDEGIDCGDDAFRSAMNKATVRKKRRPQSNACKSLSGMPLTEEEIEDIPARIKRYRSLSYRCMAAAEKHKPKNQKLYSLDVQYALVILDFQFKYANENHGAPVNRAEAWWNWMVKEGHFTRGWDGKKWAAIHRMLVDCGVLNVIDNKYWFYAEGQKTGKAMQYHIKEEYLAVASNGGEASIQEVKISYLPQRCRPCRVLPPERQSDYWSSPHWRRMLSEILYEAAA